MPANSSRARQFREFAEKGDLTAFEELWLSLIDSDPADIETFIEGAESLESVGNFDRAALFLNLVWPVLRDQGLNTEALAVLRKVAQVPSRPNQGRDDEVREGLVAVYRAVHADSPHLEAYLETSGLIGEAELKKAVKQLDIYLTFTENSYLFHPAGWGAGRISAVDPVALSVVIDFHERPGHKMAMDMAAKVTESIADNDLRAMKYDRREQLVAMLDEDPLELVRCALRSRRGKATLRDIRDRIAGDLIDTKAWSRWWQKARQKVKVADDITITPGSNPTLELGAGPEPGEGGYAGACMKDLGAITDDGKRVRYLRDVIKEIDAHEDGPHALARVIQLLLGKDQHAGNMELGPRISLAFLLAEHAKKAPEVQVPEDFTPASLVGDKAAVLECLPKIPIASHRSSIYYVLKDATPEEERLDLATAVMERGEPDAADVAMADLVRIGEVERMNGAITRITSRYREMPNAFLWYFKLSKAGKLPKDARKESIPALVEKALILHSEIEVSNIRKKDSERMKAMKGLATVFQSREYAIIKDAFTDASESEAKSIAALLRNNRSLKQENRDKMLATMFRTRPELAKADAQGQEEKAENPLFDPRVIWCTESSLIRKRTEYEDLVNRQIPENAAEIGRAASYGDLSENAEWAAAIEKQTQLTKLSEELGGDISKARIINEELLGSTDDGASIGHLVTVKTPDGDRKSVTLLGPWEVNNERDIISYLSPLGRALVGKKVGDVAAVEVPSGTVDYEVLELEAADIATAES